MERLPFFFTIAFVLLGPVKIIHPFAKLTRDAEPHFARSLAINAALIAATMCLLVAIAGRGLVSTYELSPEALQLAGGLVLLLSALKVIFPAAETQPRPAAKPTALQLAISPLASPIIVTPAGIAAILLFVMSAQAYPGVYRALALVLALILLLDFLAMYFNAQILRVPGLLPSLQIVGAVLIFIQVALGIETMVRGLEGLGLVNR